MMNASWPAHDPESAMPKEDPRLDMAGLLDELKSWGKDLSGISEQPLKVGSIKKLVSTMADVHEEIMGTMDATTRINMLPFAWCDTAISWKDVNFKVKDAAGAWRTILKDCTGHLPAGKLLALMGPSGCGKSTLLDILAQKKTTPYEGNVHCNGHDIKGDPYFKRYTTYVPQSDDMHEVLTVKETVLFNAALKNPPPSWIKVDPELKSRMPEVILSTLGLREVENTIIGGDKSGLRGVSGGQKRRVTLARGAISGAQVLFADEPTSGLSATDAETCIKMLRFLTRRIGLTCIVVIHQPRVEVAELFDQLILLTAYPDRYGGSTVYNGPMNGTIDYCAAAGYPVPDRANPADWLMDMVSPGYKHVLVKRGIKKVDESVTDYVNYYKNKCAADVKATVDKIIADPKLTPMELVGMRWTRMQKFMDPEAFKGVPPVRKSVYGSSFGFQAAVLFATKLKILKRDKKGLRMRVGMSIMQGIIVGLAFQDISSKVELQHIQFIFMAMQLASMSGMQVMPGLVDLRNVMKKDVDEGLHSVTAWIIGNCIIDAIITVITSTLFITIIFLFAGFDFEIYGRFFFWVLLCICVMDSYFNVIAAVAPNGQLATVMAMPCMIMFILFNGFLVSKTSAPDFMVWALFVSPFYYAITSLAMAIYGEDNCSTLGCRTVIATYGFDDGPSQGACIGVLAGLFVAFRLLQVVALMKLNRAEK